MNLMITVRLGEEFEDEVCKVYTGRGDFGPLRATNVGNIATALMTEAIREWATNQEEREAAEVDATCSECGHPIYRDAVEDTWYHQVPYNEWDADHVPTPADD